MGKSRYYMKRGTRKTLLRLCLIQNYQCFYCKDPMTTDKAVPQTQADRATLDHIIPVSRGGPNKVSNKIACCYRCNQAKGNMTISEYLESRTQ